MQEVEVGAPETPPTFPGTTALAWATLRALKELAVAGTVSELNDRITTLLDIRDEDAAYVAPGYSTPVIYTKLGNARTHLQYAGYITQSERGVWALTRLGAECRSPDDLQGFTGAYQQVLRARKQLAPGSGLQGESVAAERPASGYGAAGSDGGEEETQWQDEVLAYLHELTPLEFEHFIKELLAEMGMTELHVTRQTGDSGIDVVARHEVGGGITLRVRVQCKRYDPTVSVGRPEVQQLVGAMQNADHAVLVTTASVTRQAREFAEECPKRVDLWDGIGLCGLMAKYGVGVRAQTTYRIDVEQFERVRAAARQ